jgi:hypothetical protein
MPACQQHFDSVGVIAPKVQAIANPKLTKSVVAIAKPPVSPKNSASTVTQVRVPPAAPKPTAASSANVRQRKCCRRFASKAARSASALSTSLAATSTWSATRASRAEKTLSNAAMPDNRNIGASATWMMCTTESSAVVGIAAPIPSDA